MQSWSGMFSCILAVHVWKEAFSVFIVSRLLYLFFIKNFGWLEKDKSGSLVLLKGGWCWELGGGRGGEFLNSCWGRVWATNTDKNEFSGGGRWDRKENSTRSASTLFWFYCKNWSGRSEASGNPALPVMVWTGNGCGGIWELFLKLFFLFFKERCRAE